MTETAGLVIRIESVGAARATSELDRLGRSAKDAEGKIGLIPGAMSLIGKVAASAAVATATSAYIRMADASANMAARLKLATGSTEEFNRAQAATYQIAQRSSTELASVVDLYAKLSQSTGELGVSQADLLQLTESITQTFQISGASAQEASGGLRQLSQAMAGGVLRAEEFNSIIESAPRLVQAMADGMGIAFGDVRKAVNDGKVSSEILVQALLTQSEVIQTEFDQMPLTVGRAMTQLRNSLTGMVGDADAAGGASKNLAEAISDLARTLESQQVKDGFAGFVSGLSDVVEFASKAGVAIDYLNRSRLAFAGVREQASSAIRMGLFGASGQWDAVRQEYRQGYVPGSQKVGSAFAPTPAGPAEPVSATQGIADFAKAPVPTATATLDTATGKVRTPRARAAPRGPSDREIMDLSGFTRDQIAAESATQGWLNRIELLRAELEGPLAVATLAYRQALEEVNAAQVAGHITAEQAAEAQGLIRDEYTKTAETIKKGGETMDEFAVQAARNMQTTFSNFLFDPFGDRTENMADRFAEALRRMAADAAAAKLLEGLGGAMSGYGGGGWWGALINGIGAAMQGGGRAFGGPVQAGQSYRVGERGAPEIFTPSTSGRITPMDGASAAPRVKLEVINNGPPMQASTQQMSQPDGSQLIRLVLNAVGDSFASGSGAPYAAAKGRFNLKDAV